MGEIRFRATAGLALVALVVALVGCAQDGERADATVSEAPSATSEPPLDRSRTMVANVRVVASGAASFEWEGRQEVVFTRVGREGLDVNVLTGGFAEPEILPQRRADRFRWAFDLLAQYRDTPGEYTIEKAQKGVSSAAFLIWMRVKDPAKEAVYDMAEVEFLKTFDDLRQPCTLEVLAPEEARARLTCPELATDDGETIRLEVFWEKAA